MGLNKRIGQCRLDIKLTVVGKIETLDRKQNEREYEVVTKLNKEYIKRGTSR